MASLLSLLRYLNFKARLFFYLQASLKLFELAYKKMAAERESSGSSQAESEEKSEDQKKSDSN